MFANLSDRKLMQYHTAVDFVLKEAKFDTEVTVKRKFFTAL